MVLQDFSAVNKRIDEQTVTLNLRFEEQTQAVREQFEGTNTAVKRLITAVGRPGQDTRSLRAQFGNADQLTSI